jgi:hypothetical protein
VRLEQYLLTEEYKPEEVIEMVRKNCSEALDAMSRTHNALWRGSNDRIEYIKEFTPRKDRRPRDTKQWVHELIDEEFEKRFGWRVRSEGTFATASKAHADTFGDEGYLFFPFDGFEVVWSDKVSDLTNRLAEVNYSLDRFKEEEAEKMKILAKKLMDKWMKTYEEGNIDKAIYSMGEIAFKCSKYYLVSDKMWNEGFFEIIRGYGR